MRPVVASLVLVGCYSPAPLTECAVTCETPGAPCGSGLTCGDDHLCFTSAPCTHPDATTPPDACQASDVDLDGDCIVDAMDDCIAPAADALGDFDNDGLDNGPDPCPWDSVTMGDTDGDSIPSPCDPFPNQSGDRKRCTMAFSSTALTVQLWGKRGNNDLLWTTTTANKISGDGTSQQASIRALASFEGAFATTYDAVVTLRGGDAATFTLWVRASNQPGTDVGCQFGNGDLFVVGPSTDGDVGQPVGTVADPAQVHVRATVVPMSGTTNVRCSVKVGMNTEAVDARAMILSPGNVGFSVYMGSADVTGLAIYDRTSPPPSL